MPKFKLDPKVRRYMNEHGVDELEAANQLQLNIHEIYDVVEDDSDDYDIDDE